MFTRKGQSIGYRHHAELLASLIHYPDLWHPDALVDAVFLSYCVPSCAIKVGKRRNGDSGASAYTVHVNRVKERTALAVPQ